MSRRTNEDRDERRKSSKSDRDERDRKSDRDRRDSRYSTLSELGSGDDKYKQMAKKLSKDKTELKEKLKKEAEKNIANFGDGIKILNGRWGAYITDGKKNAKIPKDIEPKKITHDEAKKFLAEAPERKGRARRFTKKK